MRTKRLVRVFPRRTMATPRDALAFVGMPPLFLSPVDEVHVSVTFSWDLEEAERLAHAWRRVARVKIGGPALGDPGGEFVPGRYVAEPYLFTTRGCPGKCWWCDVPRREGAIRELHIHDGSNILDSNLLAASEKHIRAVFEMLKRQRRPVDFSGGLEARLLREWHVNLLADLKPRQIFLAFDEESDYAPLVRASKMLRASGFVGRNGGGDRRLRCFVLVGYPRDSISAAEARMHKVLRLGMMPMSMLWRGRDGRRDPEWARWSRLWSRPAAMASLLDAPVARRGA